MENKAYLSDLNEKDNKSIVRVFQRSQKPKETPSRAENTLRTFFFLRNNWAVEDIAKELKVSIRTVYRYKKICDRVCADFRLAD